MLSALARIGPPLLAEQARRWMAQGEPAVESMLVTSWRTSSTRDFLGRLVMQPYAQCLALAGVPPVDREMTRADNLCPFCGGAPQVSILDGRPASNGRARHLECGTCSTAWVFRETRCAYCGETEPRRIGRYHSPAFEHMRVDTCDACQHYLKSIDLDRLESAVPVVDEVAAANARRVGRAITAIGRSSSTSSSSDVERPDLVVVGQRVVTPSGIRSAAVHVKDGSIAAVSSIEDLPHGWPIDDAGAAVILPGLVDSHVHVNEPGRTEWEGFESATRAAAAGGVTSLVDMPLNSIPATTTVDAFDIKRARRGRAVPRRRRLLGRGHSRQRARARRAPRRGRPRVQGFLVPSGVDEFPAVSEARSASGASDARADWRGRCWCTPRCQDRSIRQGDALASRPRSVRHVSRESAERRGRRGHRPSHPVVREYRRPHAHRAPVVRDFGGADRRCARRRFAVSVETCPHYLVFAAEEVPDGATEYKCAPPIRERTNQDDLWSALDAGTIDAVVSDHSPAPPAMKNTASGDFLTAWGGIASVQLGLPVMWTAAGARGHSLERLASWMSAAPARIARLDRKGRDRRGPRRRPRDLRSRRGVHRRADVALSSASADPLSRPPPSWRRTAHIFAQPEDLRARRAIRAANGHAAHQSHSVPSILRLTGRYARSYGYLLASSSSKSTP